MYSIRNSEVTLFYIHLHYKPDRRGRQYITIDQPWGGGVTRTRHKQVRTQSRYEVKPIIPVNFLSLPTLSTSSPSLRCQLPLPLCPVNFLSLPTLSTSSLSLHCQLPLPPYPVNFLSLPTLSTSSPSLPCQLPPPPYPVNFLSLSMLSTSSLYCILYTVYTVV